MKKLVALLLLLSSPVYALSDCANKPTCEEIGYSHNEFACDQKLSVPCPFDNTKIYCTGPICEAGYFLYSDGSCSLALKSDKTVIGIVFDKDWRLAVSVEPAVSLKISDDKYRVVPDLGWGPLYVSAECESDCNGRINTQKIINYAKENNYNFPAAEHCYNLSVEGKGKGNWWLPSMNEMARLYNQISLVDASLEAAGKQTTVKSSHWTAQQWLFTDESGVKSAKGRYLNLSHKGSAHWNAIAALPVMCVTRY